MDLAETKFELLELAESPALSERKDSLLGLAGAIDSDDAHLWAKIDLFAAFGEDAVAVPKSASRDQQIVRWEWARNILVLAPLIITWLGLWAASRQYGRLTRAAADGHVMREVTQRPFIALWEQGFNNIPGFDGGTWFSLTYVALLDVLAIAMVIVASLAIGWLRQNREVKLEGEFQAVWNRLREALTWTSYHLATRAFDTPAKVTEEMNKAVSQLRTITDHVLDAEERAKNRLDQITESIIEFNDHLAAHGEVVAGLNATAGSVRDHLRSTRDDITQISTWFADAASQERELVDQLQATAQQLESTAVQSLTQAADIASETSRLVTALNEERGAQSAVSDAIGNSSNALRAFADEVHRRWEQLGDDRIDLRDELESLRTILEQTGTQLQDLADHVNVAYQMFPEVRRSNEELVEGFRSTAQALRESAAEITTQISGQLESFLVRTTDRLDEQAQAANHQVTTSLNEAAETLAGTAEAVVARTQESLHSYLTTSQEQQDAAQRLSEQIISGLQNAATALSDAGNAIRAEQHEATEDKGNLRRSIDKLLEAIETLAELIESLPEPPEPGEEPTEEEPTETGPSTTGRDPQPPPDRRRWLPWQSPPPSEAADN